MLKSSSSMPNIVYCVWDMLDIRLCGLAHTLNTLDELHRQLQVVWDKLSQDAVD